MKPRRRPSTERAGWRVHHDVLGWYIVSPAEEEPEDGSSLGFDGRDHYDSESWAWRVAVEMWEESGR